MKNILKRALATFLVVAIVLCSAPLSGLVGLELPDWADFSIESSAEQYSGTCGANLTWTFDESTGTLTISGTGEMDSFDFDNRPWEDYLSSIVSVVIDDGVTSISDDVFGHCTSLTSVTIPNSITFIGKTVFYCCTSLANIVIPKSVTSMGYAVFYSCTSLESIIVDKDNQYYSSDEDGVLFNKDKTILIQYPMGNARTSYTIPRDVKIISGDSFAHSYNLTSVVIPEGISKINECTFYCCFNLANIDLPTTIIEIGEWAFAGCNSLTDIQFGDNLTTIGPSAFEECNNITWVFIPESVTSISSNSFYPCEKLNNIYVDDNNKDYSSDANGVLFNKDKTTLIKYPNGNTRTSYIIPDSVLSIGDQAFNLCDNLTSITIPDSVTSIDYLAFRSCTSLVDVYYSGTEAQWNEIDIGEYNEDLLNAKIHYNCETPSDKLGDANGDGKVTAIDARVTLQAAAGLEPLTDDLIKVLDMNNDGKVTAIDARWILQISAGLK